MIDPNGLIMDYLRAGYEAPARWRQSGDDTVSIRWYRAAPDAKVYLLPHAFGSTVWDEPDDIADEGPGEIPGIREWAGSPPNPPPGQATTTPPDWFAHGVPNGVPIPPCPAVFIPVSICNCQTMTFVNPP